MAVPVSVDAERRAASGVFGEPGSRRVVYDTTVPLPPSSSPNRYSRWTNAKARKDLNKIGWGMYQAYSPGVRFERARMTITLRVCRHWRATEAYPAYRPLDGDNLIAACKGLIDGIVRAGMLTDDRTKYLDPPIGQLVEVATPFEEGILVTIEEVQ